MITLYSSSTIFLQRKYANYNRKMCCAYCCGFKFIFFFCDNQFIKRPIHNSSKNFWRPNKGAKTFFKQSKRFRFQYVMIMFSSSFWTHELTHVTEQRKGYCVIILALVTTKFWKKPFLGLIWILMSVYKFWKDFQFMLFHVS